MKKFIAVILTMVLTMSVAYAQDADRELDVVRSLGIIRGNENGDLMLSKGVTRAEFAKMSTMASSFRDNVSGNAYVSLFSDVRSEHWASGYIKVAVDNGWFTGYVDGSFRPNNPIKYEEGITVVLRIMGYDFSKSVGVFPNVQLDKAREIGLLKNLNGARGVALSREQCKTLFYNMMVSKSADGKVLYGESIGLPISGEEVDYLAMIYKDLEGPFVYNGNEKLLGGMKLYKNGSECTSLNKYDVYYYNKGIAKTFAFDKKVVGRVESIEPNTVNPESVSINGVKYELAGYDSKLKFSSLGSIKKGDTAILLKGKDGKVVDVVTSAGIREEYYGLLLENKENKYEADGKTVFRSAVTIMCADGVKRDFLVDYSSLDSGKFVKVKISDKEMSMSSMGERALSGKLTSKGIDGHGLAEVVSVADAYKDKMEALSIDDVLGVDLDKKDVLFYETDSHGNITNLILNDFTGDLKNYGFLYGIDYSNHDELDDSKFIDSNNNGKMDDDEQYETYKVDDYIYKYYINGTAETLSGSSANYSIGGIEVYQPFSKSKYLFRELKSVKAYKVKKDEMMMDTKDGDIKIAPNVQVYVRRHSDYQLASLDGINAGDYKLTAYYNKAGIGKRIRVIVAENKED